MQEFKTKVFRIFILHGCHLWLPSESYKSPILHRNVGIWENGDYFSQEVTACMPAVAAQHAQ